MAAVPPRSERRRPRPGSLDQPVNGRLYRGTWLLVGLPLLVAAFSVARPHPLPAPQLPPAFDGQDAKALASDLADYYPGSSRAAVWFRDQLGPYGLRIHGERFSAVIPGQGRRAFENLVAVVPGRSAQTIVVMAHRDSAGAGRGANDNASGTAALVELAQTYSVQRGVSAAHTIVFLSTDGGLVGGLGAAEFLAHSPERHDVIAVINLDAIAGGGRPRLDVWGDTPRTASGTLLETAAARIARQTGLGPARPSIASQLLDLGFPFSLREQAPFVSSGIGAVTLTTEGARRAEPERDTRINAVRLGQIGRAAQDLLGTLDQGLEFATGTSSYIYVGSRIVRGWAVELVLIAALFPFFAAAVDLFARCRRRRIALGPAFRSYRSRLAFWAWVAVLFELFALLGFFPDGVSRPPALASAAARDWPAFPLLMLGLLAGAGWLVTRDRLLPRRTTRADEELAGYTTALLCLAAVALLVVATNPFALVFVLPSLHAWLWLPNLRARAPWLRTAVLAIGFLGPAVLIGSFAFRYGLGWDAPWYIAELRVLGYVSFAVVLVMVPWLAGAGQLAALAARRYAPYPSAAERPPLGPARRVMRRTVLAMRRRRRASVERRRALEG